MRRVRSVDEVEGVSGADTGDVGEVVGRVEEEAMEGLKDGTMIDGRGMIGIGEVIDVGTEMIEGMIDGIGITMTDGTVIVMREGTGMIAETEIAMTGRGIEIEIENVKTEETEIERIGANDSRTREGRDTIRISLLRTRKQTKM